MHPLIAAQAASPQPPLLPTWQQAMHASLGLVQSTLQQLIELMVDDPDRDDSEVDVDCAVELALEHIKRMGVQQHADRSEEHTSELQSPCNLVCRLLLEKKKKQNSCSIVRYQ